MRRVARDERGATAVVVAILLVVLVGFGALAVDVGALWWDKKQLQNGADAAALALAQSCALGACESDQNGFALQYARGNKLDGNVAVTEVSPLNPTSWVKVEVKTERAHWLAPVIGFDGFDSSDVNAAATAAWGGIGAAKVIPLTVSMCEVSKLSVGTDIEIWVKADDSNALEGCDGSAGAYAPGNFGWLTPGSGTCIVDTSAGAWAPGRTGNAGHGYSGPCHDTLSGLHLEESVLVPVFDSLKGNGSGVEYHLTGYVSMKISAYCLNNSASANWRGNVDPPTTPTCTGNSRWIRATFIEYLELGAEIGGPNYGSTTVQLTG